MMIIMTASLAKQLLMLAFVAAFFAFATSATPNGLVPYEYDALKQLYTDNEGAKWTWRDDPNLHWDFSPSGGDPCLSQPPWQGITCTSNGTVSFISSLSLYQYNISGTLSSAIGSFTALQKLYVSNNRIAELPDSLGNLVLLEILDVSSNKISALPSRLGSLYGKLLELNAYSNILVATIPSSLYTLTSLEVLQLQENNLSGSISTKIGDLKALRGLDFSMNSLVGALPSEIGTLTALEYLRLYSNSLTKPLPSSLVELTNLLELAIKDNYFGGKLPSGLAMLSNLELAWFSSCAFTGPIPHFGSVASCEFLTDLEFDSNAFTGPLPSSLGQCSNIQTLYLSDNSFTNTIPSALTLLTQATSLTLGNNLLNGTIPSSFANLVSLKALYLSNNRLTGTIPIQIGDMSSLTSIFLGFNNLRGSIPEELGKLGSSLVLLNLANNKNLRSMSQYSNSGLTGSLPSSLYAMTELVYFDVSQNLLTGTVSSNTKLLTKLAQFDIYVNSFSGVLPSDIIALTSLESFEIFRNEFVGTVPTVICTFKGLSQLAFYSNNFVGTLPSCLSALTNVAVLDVSNNRLTGKLPSAVFAAMKKLTSITVSDNSFSSTLPSALTGLSALTILKAQGNNLKSPVPTLPVTLQVLDLSSNSFSYAAIPSSIMALTDLLSLNVSKNSIRGVIPSTLGMLTKLTSLSLYSNLLSGTIPADVFAALQGISSLDLSNNKLVGNPDLLINTATQITTIVLDNNALVGNLVPDLGGKRDNLVYLSLSNNKMRGKLPSSYPNTLNYLNVGWNAFTGQIPSALGSLKRLKTLILQGNVQLTGTLQNNTLHHYGNSSLSFVPYALDMLCPLASPPGVASLIDVRMDPMLGCFASCMLALPKNSFLHDPGLQVCILEGVPTPAPSPTPTIRPTPGSSSSPHQTFQPTLPSELTTPSPTSTLVPPSAGVHVDMAVTQVILGCSLSDYDSSEVAYSTAMQVAVANTISNKVAQISLSTENVLNVQASAVASRRQLLGSDSVSMTYEVSYTATAISFDLISALLTLNVENGNFDDFLTQAALRTGATGFVNATSSSVTIRNLLIGAASSDSASSTISAGGVAGIVLAVLAIVALSFSFYYYKTYFLPKRAMALSEQDVQKASAQHSHESVTSDWVPSSQQGSINPMFGNSQFGATADRRTSAAMDVTPAPVSLQQEEVYQPPAHRRDTIPVSSILKRGNAGQSVQERIAAAGAAPALQEDEREDSLADVKIDFSYAATASSSSSSSYLSSSSAPAAATTNPLLAARGASLNVVVGNSAPSSLFPRVEDADENRRL